MSSTRSTLDLAVAMVERGWMPSSLTRTGIRRLCRRRLLDEHESPDSRRWTFLDSMEQGPVAPVPEKANEQHYEVPAEFFRLVLGPHLKYSSCLWSDTTRTLGEAERAALEATCARAGIADGMDVLELGCGWGSLTLWMAEQYPGCRIVAVSNSAPQRRFITARAEERGLGNVRVMTADMNDFATDDRFDRVVSVEMFEHMRNYRQLLRRISEWLRPGGRLFVHMFTHRSLAYEFDDDGADNWMGRYFFSGGIMPSHELLRRFDDDLRVVHDWWWDGTHYQRTSEAWLANLQAARREVMPILATTYGRDDARRWYERWRVFFMAVAEQFGYADGQEWGVSHYLLAPNAGVDRRQLAHI